MATESVKGEFEGRPVHIFLGVTTVRAGHPLLDQHPGRFVPLRPMFEVEAAPDGDADGSTPVPESAPPAPPSPDAAPAAKDVRAWAAEQGIDVPARGQLPATIVEQYQAAQQGA